MMARLLTMVCVAGGALLLSACSETPQGLGGVKSDVAPYKGVDNAFAAPGWTAGDKTSWEQGLKARTQNTQNEYNKSK